MPQDAQVWKPLAHALWNVSLASACLHGRSSTHNARPVNGGAQGLLWLTAWPFRAAVL